MLFLKQSTSVVVSFGPFIDETDGKTAITSLVTALDHATTGIMLSKNGGALTIRHATVTATTYDAYGNYRVTLDTTDTNTLGTLRMQFYDVATNLPVWQDFMVCPANVWDSLFGADNLQVDTTQWLGTACATPTVNGVPEVDVTHWIGTAAATPTVAGVPEVDITHIAGAAVSTSTAQLGVNAVQAGGTAWGSGAITAASIATGAIDADSLAADAGAEIADAVWDEARAGHVAAGSFGEGVASVQGNVTGSVASVTGAVGSVTGLTASNLDATISSRASQASLDIVDDFLDTEIAAIKTKTDFLPSATAGSAGGLFIAGANAATSITTALTANITGDLSGSVGSVTGAVGSVTGNVGGNVAGSVGSVTGAVGSVTGLTAATVHADLDDIQARLPAALVSGRMDSSVGAVANDAITAASIATGAIDADAIADNAIDAGAIATGAITAAKFAAGAIDAAALNSDAVNEIWAKALTELSAVPGVTTSALDALNWVFTLARNKITQTATTGTIYKDDGTTSIGTSTVSDDGTTATRGEWT